MGLIVLSSLTGGVRGGLSEDALPQDLIRGSGFVGAPPQAVGVIVGFQDHRTIAGRGDQAQILPQAGKTFEVGEELILFRTVRHVVHPRTGERMGDLIRVVGVAKVLEIGEMIQATIVASYDSISIGDRLFTPSPPSQTIRRRENPSPRITGYIIEVKEDKGTASRSEIVYLDVGDRDGVQAGDRFRVMRDLSQTIGQLLILTVQEKTATALITQSADIIQRGDRIESVVD